MPANTPRLALPYPIPDDTVDVPRDMQALAVKLDATPDMGVPIVSALPSVPADGTEVYYSPGSGVLWHFRYDAGGDQWFVLSGEALENRVETAETTASTAFGNLATIGPQVLIPLAGVYWVEVDCQLSTAPNAGNGAYCSPSVNGAGGSDGFAYQISTGAAFSLTGRGSSGRSRWGFTPGQYARAVYRSSSAGAGTITAQRRSIHVWPARIYGV